MFLFSLSFSHLAGGSEELFLLFLKVWLVNADFLMAELLKDRSDLCLSSYRSVLEVFFHSNL